MMEDFEFFWKNQLSQWYMVNFEVNGITFNCAEQFMMFCKAVFFGDLETADKILQSKNPAEQKGFGRKVKNFDVDKWSDIAREIVYVGNMARFQQNDSQYKALMATNGRTLVEASPYDTVWGIGLTKYDHRAHQRETWRGSNWLGEVLTRVRNDLRFNEKVDEKTFDLVDNIIEKWIEEEK